MLQDHPEFARVVAELKDGRTPNPVTIRTFLSWFGAQRRTQLNVEYINSHLTDCNVRTVPDYLNIWVDTPITFELMTKHQSSNSSKKPKHSTDTQSDDVDLTKENLSHSIGNIRSSNIRPVSVKPNDNINVAKTLMITNDYSQLPVMTNERTVKGIISWKSIGTRTITDIDSDEVRSFMEPAYNEVPINKSMFDAITLIAETDYVLVRGFDQTITGIVTSTDIALQFESTSTPFLLIGEIEVYMKKMISKRVEIDQIKKTCNKDHLPNDFINVDQLTFGNCVRIIEHPENWDLIGFNLDRKSFCEKMDKINDIRNDVMHFDPDTSKQENMTVLRNISGMFRHLYSIGAI